MAKAILGYVGGTDSRLVAEMRRLQRRIRDLETELDRVQAKNESLTDALSPALHAGLVATLPDEELLHLEAPEREPALT